MATLFNQTNLTPTASFSGNGGSGGNISANIIQGTQTLNNQIDMNNGGAGIITSTGNNPIVFSYNDTGDTRCQILPVGGVMIGFFNDVAGTHPGGYWALGNNLAATNWGVSISSISSIGGTNGNKTINVPALISTLTTVYPGCVG